MQPPVPQDQDPPPSNAETTTALPGESLPAASPRWQLDYRGLFIAFLFAFAVPALVVLALQSLALGPERLARLVASNDLAKPNRDLVILTGVGCGAAACLLLAVWLTLGKDRWSPARLERAQRLGYLFSPLLLLPFIPPLWNWRLFRSDPILRLLVVAMVGFLCERALTASLAAGKAIPFASSLGARLREAIHRIPRRVPAILLGVAMVALGLYFSFFLIRNHLRMQTASLDLGVFDNLMWHLTRGHYFRSAPAYGHLHGSHIARHANWIAYLFVPFYALCQRAETLLVLQAFLLMFAAIPLFLVARRRLGGDWLALGIALAYLLYAPMHSPMFYDFHFLTTAPFFVGWVIYFFEIKSRRGLVIAGLLAIMVREDVGLGLSMLALFYLLGGDRPRTTTLCGILAVIYFVAMKFWLMPLHACAEDPSFADTYEGLYPAGEFGFGSVLRTLYVNPIFVLSTLLKPGKIEYVLQVMVPVLFLPFRHRRAWLPFLAAMIFTILASHEAFSQIHFQYVTHWNCYVFFMSVFVLAAWRENGRLAPPRLPVAVVSLLVVGLLASYKDGGLLQHHSFRGGFRSISFEWTPADEAQWQDFQALARMIPPHASVAATETEVPHFSNRSEAYTMRTGVSGAAFILVRLDEILGDGLSREKFLDGIRTGAYSFVKRQGSFALWQRGGDHLRDREGLALIRAENLFPH